MQKQIYLGSCVVITDSAFIMQVSKPAIWIQRNYNAHNLAWIPRYVPPPGIQMNLKPKAIDVWNKKGQWCGSTAVHVVWMPIHGEVVVTIAWVWVHSSRNILLPVQEFKMHMTILVNNGCRLAKPGAVDIPHTQKNHKGIDPYIWSYWASFWHYAKHDVTPTPCIPNTRCAEPFLSSSIFWPKST